MHHRPKNHLVQSIPSGFVFSTQFWERAQEEKEKKKKGDELKG